MSLTLSQTHRQGLVGFLVVVCLAFSGLQIYCQFSNHASSPANSVVSQTFGHQHATGSSKPASDSHSNALEHCSLCFLHILTPWADFDLEIFRSAAHPIGLQWASAVLARAEFLRNIAPRAPPMVFSSKPTS